MSFLPVPGPLLHRPLGGHPYRVEPDQRHPVHALVGEPVELCVLADPDVRAVRCEVELEDGAREVLDLTLRDLAEVYAQESASDGHLMAASRSLPDVGGRSMWTTTFTTPDAPYRYRFVADEPAAETRWWAAGPASWRPVTDELRVVGNGERVVPGTAHVLCTHDGPVRLRVEFRLAAGDHVVGFGERFDRLDQRGARLDAVVFEQYRDQGNRTYLPSPFAHVVGDAPWGLHVRTSRRVWFDVGATTPDVLAVEAALDPAHPHLEIRVHDGAPLEVLAAHLDETGAPVLPPSWVFRPWMSGNEWNTQARVLAEVRRSVELDIPVGVMVIEAWSDESTFTVFRDARYEVRADGAPLSLAEIEHPADGAWPDPVAMVEELHALGVKVLLWQIPLVPTDRGDDGQVAADAATLASRGWCVHDEDGRPYRNRGWWFPGALLPDWTNPAARQWWIDKRRYLLTEIGIDGFKTDGGEHAWGDDLHYADGSRGDASNNLSAHQFAAAYHELLAQTGTEGTTFSRSGYTGAATVPCHWAGDEASTWPAFRASITAGLTAGASGVLFWGWDIAGFSGELPSVELWARASAMAALCPIMQYHSEYHHHQEPCHDRTPWNLAAQHDDPRAITIYRRFAHLRERLVPYLTELAAICVRERAPMMRPLCFDHPADEAVWSHPHQYHLGPDILVAPVCEDGAQRWPVYLPAGEWVDAWTGDVLDGGRVVERDVPWHEIPVYLRGDAARVESIVRAAFVDLPPG